MILNYHQILTLLLSLVKSLIHPEQQCHCPDILDIGYVGYVVQFISVKVLPWESGERHAKDYLLLCYDDNQPRI